MDKYKIWDNLDWGTRLSPDALPDALLSLSRRGTPKAQTNDELRRLSARSPLRIAEPVFHDPDTGLLFLDEE